MSKELPDLATVESLLNYDAETGIFTWKVSQGTKQAGMPAGHLDRLGYVRISINGQLYAAHRLAWLLSRKLHPPECLDIDHANGIRSDNRASNVRVASRADNKRNGKTRSDSRCGIKGIRLRKGRWSARIFYDGKSRHLGCFGTAEEAKAAYEAAAQKVFGEFARSA